MTGPHQEPHRQDLLARILAPSPPPFAVLHRPEATGAGVLEIIIGEVSLPATLQDIPVPEPRAATGTPRHEVLALVPYRQITERGFAAPDDGTPLIAIEVTEQETVSLAEAAARIPDHDTTLTGARFDIDDDTYARTVRTVINDEIGEGEGANFVIKRTFTATMDSYGPGTALTFFRRLLEREKGAYWTFAVHTGDRTLVGATPERHISVHGGTAVMNPISGTYRYPATGPALGDVMDFLADRKEADELYMVVDEELKMMARVCETGGRVRGPYLKEMARLAHTEYFIEGRTTSDARRILHETMFAPTVTGSPLENAAKVISRYEPEGRGYYSGVLALIGRDGLGGPTLDSSILIRTADIDPTGLVRIGVGATLVRHSDPLSEVAETRAKAAGLIAALENGTTGKFATHPRVRHALERRNETISGFWLADESTRPLPTATTATADLTGRRVLVVDAEDTFTSMIGHQLRSIGMEVTVRRFDEPYSFTGHDLIVMGPGPGDPREREHPKIAHLHSAIRRMLHEGRPFLAVCLSHQILSTQLGFGLIRRNIPNQGVQKDIDLFGQRERVGFYNTFAARSDHDRTSITGIGTVDISRDPHTGEVHSLRGPHFASMQFHPESVLTQYGVRILGGFAAGLLHRTPLLLPE